MGGCVASTEKVTRRRVSLWKARSHQGRGRENNERKYSLKTTIYVLLHCDSYFDVSTGRMFWEEINV